MAKKRYLSHEELGITFAEWGALFGFKAIAEAGIVLKPVPVKEILKNSVYAIMDQHPGVHFFDMARTCHTQECGSVACIGGTVAMFMRLHDPSAYVTQHDAHRTKLDTLYYPRWNNGRNVALKAPRGYDDDGSLYWERITPKMAAQAVDNFLRTGTPNWDKVIPKSMQA